MKPLNLFLVATLFFVTPFHGFSNGFQNNCKPQQVNSILGDMSSYMTFGFNQDVNSITEQNRVKTHLLFVHNLLKNKEITSLTQTQKQNRATILNVLSEYIGKGEFPLNYDYIGQRKPCFIDKNGRICAVGYLIAKTEGIETAEYINTNYKYDYIKEMDDPLIYNWAKKHGLSIIECAMIQPNYGNPPTQNNDTVEKDYAIASGVALGINTSLSIFNTLQIVNNVDDLKLPVIGIISGTGQALIGVLNYPETEYNFNGVDYNLTEQKLSIINIGVGTATVLLSGWNLLDNKKVNDNAISYGFDTMYTPTNEAAAVLTLAKK